MDEVAEKKAVHAVPPTPAGRKRLREIIADVWAEASLTPPLSMDELSDIALRLIRTYGLDEAVKGWLMVEINNCAWKEVVASVPYDKRILLLPQCLRHSTLCRAETDELGLLCGRCGSCTIPSLQDKAEDLGMIALVAEGFTPVMGLMESGVADTVIGVGCLDSLEKAFPLLVRHAVPGIAVPLNRAGCKDTQVDDAYVESLMRMLSPSQDPAALLVHDEIKALVRDWFLPDRLEEILGEATDPASCVAREWLSGDGKRWRPYLLVCVYLSLTGRREIPDSVRRAAVAVECFHKASLVHDDIQDNDAFRNSRQTVHAAHGVPVAVNAGDILLGEGYRVLASCGRMELMQAAADAHVALCKGQGMELQWSRSPGELRLEYVLDIFSRKTVPAFEVALLFGLICAGAPDSDAQGVKGVKGVKDILHTYSRALGIAYQLQDDADDFAHDAPLALRPSATLAVLCEQNRDAGYIRLLHGAGNIKDILSLPEHTPLLRKAVERVTALAGDYHRQALASLSALHNMEMKRLLFRLTERILKQ
jgi:geranylgeranyl pyrophosphate synthase